MGRFMLVARSFVIKNGKLLLIRRVESDSHNPGLWECPGGKIDERHGFPYGRMLEVMEETGLLVEPVSRISYVENYVIPDGKHAGTSCLRVFSLMRPKNEYAEVELNEREHDSFVWVTYPEMLKYDLTPEVRNAAKALSDYLF
ncbi:MAG: NUDIX domain-containing protein [Candidatus Paceibacterota bacterium]